MSPTVLAAGNSGNAAPTIALYVAIGVAFYFLMIRPQRNRARAIQQAQASIGVGVEVITTSGVYGRIVAENEDDTLLLEIAPGMPIRIARSAILRPSAPPVKVETADADAESDEPPATN